jgi:hypothetical protein
LNDDEFQKLLDIPGVFRASEAPQPPPKQEVLDREAINRFMRDNKAEGGRINQQFGTNIMTLNPLFPEKNPADLDSFKPLDVPGMALPAGLTLGGMRLKDIFFSKNKDDNKKNIIPSDDKTPDQKPPEGPDFTELGLELLKESVKNREYDKEGFFENINKYSLDNHAGNLKKAISDLTGSTGKELNNVYQQITQAGQRKGFTFDRAGRALTSNIPKINNPIDLNVLTNTLKRDPNSINNRIKELKLNKNKVYNRLELQDILGLDTTNKRKNNFFVEILKDQGLEPVSLPGGKQGFKINDVVKTIKDYSTNKLTNYESRSTSENLRKTSKEKLKYRLQTDEGLVKFMYQLNKNMRKNLIPFEDERAYIPNSTAEAGHNPVPVNFIENVKFLKNKDIQNKLFSIQNMTWQFSEVNRDLLRDTQGGLLTHLQTLDKYFGKTKTEKNAAEIDKAAEGIVKYFDSLPGKLKNIKDELYDSDFVEENTFGKLVFNNPEIGQKITSDSFNIDMSNVDPRFIMGNVDLINPDAIKYNDLSKEEKIQFGQRVLDQKIDQLTSFYKSAGFDDDIINEITEALQFGSYRSEQASKPTIGIAEKKGVGFKSGGGVEITSLPRANFGNGGAAGADENFLKELEFYFTNEDAELPKMQTYKETMNPIEVLNDIIDPRNYPYYADVLARSGVRIAEFAGRILPATGKLVSDIVQKGPFRITGGSGNNYVQDYEDVLPSNIRGTGIFSEFLQNITPTSLEKKIGLDKLIKAEEQKQIDRGSTAGPKVLADTIGLGAEVTAPIFPGLKLLNAFAKARNLPNDKVAQKILEKEVDKVLSEKGMNRREFLQATGATATVVMAKMLGLMDVAPKVAKVVRTAPVMDNTVQGMPAWFKDAVYAIERKGLLKSRGDIKGIEPDFFEITLDTKLGKKKVLMSKNDRDGEITLDWTTSYYDMELPVTITYRPGQSGKQNFLSDPEFAQSVEKYDVEVEAPEFEYKTVDTSSMGVDDTNFDSAINLDIKQEADAVVEALEDLALGLTKKEKKSAAENFRYYNEVELDESSVGPDTANPIDESDAFPFLDMIKRNKDK